MSTQMVGGIAAALGIDISKFLELARLPLVGNVERVGQLLGSSGLVNAEAGMKIAAAAAKAATHSNMTVLDFMRSTEFLGLFFGKDPNAETPLAECPHCQNLLVM